jgi:hypothetical protein
MVLLYREFLRQLLNIDFAPSNSNTDLRRVWHVIVSSKDWTKKLRFGSGMV